MKNIKDLVKIWKTEIYDKSQEIDPDNNHYWNDLALGFLLAHGVEVNEAKTLSLNMGYDQGIDSILNSK